MKQNSLNYLHRIVKSKWFTIFFLCVLFSYLTIVPNIYSWNMRMPEESEIQRSYGRLIYKGNNKTGYYPGIINKKGVKEFFSCRLSEGTRHLCNVSKETFNTLKYKQTEIGWYHQKTSPISSHKRVIYLTVNNKKIITENDLEKKIKIAHEMWKENIISYLIIMTLCLMGVNFLLNLQKKQALKNKQENRDE